MVSLKIFLENIYMLGKPIDDICYFDQDGAKYPYNSNNSCDLHLLAFKVSFNRGIERFTK